MRLVLAAAACLLLAACSGGASGQARKPSPPSLMSASAVGKAVGCQTPLRTDQSLAQVEKHCKVDGKVVSIIRYPDAQTAKMYVQMGSAFGASYVIVNDHWMLSGPRPLMARLAKAHGWALQQ